VLNFLSSRSGIVFPDTKKSKPENGEQLLVANTEVGSEWRMRKNLLDHTIVSQKDATIFYLGDVGYLE
jgi:co-chaperonin GroES (HSP10)